jgi:arsenite-transporting ATPase
METHWSEIEKYITEFFKSQGFDEVTAKEMVVVPGIELLFGLFQLRRLYGQGYYDVVVVDTAPTADTLRLLSLPDAVDWYMQRFFGLGKKTIKTVQYTWGKFMGIPFPKEAVYDTVEELHQKLKDTRKILVDPDITSIRLVCNPERMVINETQRAFNYLGLFGFPIEAVVVNRIMPDDVEDEYFKKYKRLQARYMKIIKDNFLPIPILTAHLFDTEVVGLERLKELAQDLFGEDGDPTVVMSRERPVRVYEKDGYNILSIKLPFARREDLDIHTRTDELIVRVGGFKRAILLPRALAGQQPAGAEFRGGRLIVKFKRREPVPTPPPPKEKPKWKRKRK